MRPPQLTLTARDVQTLFEAWLAPVLGPWPAVRSCTVSTVCALLAYAAHRLSSLADACRRLADAPDSDTVLNRLAAQLDDPVALDRRLRAAFGGHPPRAVRNGRWPAGRSISRLMASATSCGSGCLAPAGAGCRATVFAGGLAA